MLGKDIKKQQIFHRGTLSDQEFDNEIPVWNLYVDGSSCTTSSRTGIILNSPDEIDVEYALRFQFKASNNEAKYEAMIAGLSLAKTMGAEQVVIFSDSRLIVNQMLGVYVTMGELMIKYQAKVMELVSEFVAVQTGKNIKNGECESIHLGPISISYSYRAAKNDTN